MSQSYPKTCLFQFYVFSLDACISVVSKMALMANSTCHQLWSTTLYRMTDITWDVTYHHRLSQLIIEVSASFPLGEWMNVHFRLHIWKLLRILQINYFPMLM